MSLTFLKDYAPYFFKSGTYKIVRDRLYKELDDGKEIYPPDPFRAFRICPWKSIRVCIIGQDPYPSTQADGLAFSINQGTAHNNTNSLGRIFKEYSLDLGYPIPKGTSLEDWATRGVLLMNTVLTVEKDKPYSHENIGWHWMTREVLYRLSDIKERMVFMAWGRHAQRLTSCCVDPKKHLVLEHCHPSPLTGKAWYGNKHFSKACEYLGLHREFWKLR